MLETRFYLLSELILPHLSTSLFTGFPEPSRQYSFDNKTDTSMPTIRNFIHLKDRMSVAISRFNQPALLRMFVRRLESLPSPASTRTRPAKIYLLEIYLPAINISV